MWTFKKKEVENLKWEIEKSRMEREFAEDSIFRKQITEAIESGDQDRMRFVNQLHYNIFNKMNKN